MDCFAVVHFVESNEVAAVPYNWIKGDRCAWPPDGMVQFVLPHIDKGITASETWPTFKIILLAVYATYKEAASKLSVAEVRSDLNTTDPEDCGRGKRKKRPRQLSSSSSSSEDLVENPQIKRPPSLPPISQSSPRFDDYQIDSNSLSLHTLTEIGNLPNQVPDSNAINDSPVFKKRLPKTMSPLKKEIKKKHTRTAHAIRKEFSSGLANSMSHGGPCIVKSSGGGPLCEVENLSSSQGYSENKAPEPDTESLWNLFLESSSALNNLSNGRPDIVNSSGGEPLAVENLNSSQAYSKDRDPRPVTSFEKFVIRNLTEIKMNQKIILESMDVMMRYINRQNSNREDIHEDVISPVLDSLPITNCDDIALLERKLEDEKINRQLVLLGCMASIKRLMKLKLRRRSATGCGMQLPEFQIKKTIRKRIINFLDALQYFDIFSIFL